MKYGVIAAVSAVLMVGACASAPSSDDSSAESVTFSYPAPVVQKAAVSALRDTGFDVEKAEPLYVEGFHSRRIGLVVGSGGETVGVWIDPLTSSSSRAKVATEKSIVGIVGQKSWNTEIIAAMRNKLAAGQ
ncbi:hypothetical protein [Rhodospirillum sp. A1_3_36]|uniref:hypothetical protein n=1 Tax=Rhodospirillum sp. A1_3_36 TaxID=3391666 RepID=UPI0039A46DB7